MKNNARYFGERKAREVYCLVKAVKAKHKPRSTVINGKAGNVLTDKAQVNEKWAQYCEEQWRFYLKQGPDWG